MDTIKKENSNDLNELAMSFQYISFYNYSL